MKAILCLLFISICFSASSQDTLYLDDKFQKSGKDFASYYQIIESDSPSYSIEVYDTDRDIYMRGRLASINPEIKKGTFVYYYKNGAMSKEGNYDENHEVGTWTYYDEANKKVSERIYDNGGMELHPTAVDDLEFTIVDHMPEYPGGNNEFQKYLKHSIEYPKNARKKKLEGRVYVSFLVNKDGSISDISLLKGFDSECDAEALRVIRAMPNWKPGSQNGRIVKVRYNLPINFEL